MKRGAYKFEERSQSYMGGFSGSKGKRKFNDIINTKKVKLKEEYMPIGWKSSVGWHWGKGLATDLIKKIYEWV